MIHVIKHEAYQPCGHDQCIPLHQAPFEQASGIAEHARQDRGAVDADAVNDPGIPPLRNRRGEAGEPTGGVDCAVDYVGVEPRTSFAQAHGAQAHFAQFSAAGEDVVVTFVHVVLVQQRVVDRSRSGRNRLGVIPVGILVEARGCEPSSKGDRYREEHQPPLGGAATFFSGRFRRLHMIGEHRLQEFLEMV